MASIHVPGNIHKIHRKSHCNRDIKRNKQDPFDAKNNCWIPSNFPFNGFNALCFRENRFQFEFTLIRALIESSFFSNSSFCFAVSIFFVFIAMKLKEWYKVSRKVEWRRYSYDCWISLAPEVRSFRARIMQISVEIRSRNGREEEMKGLAQLRIALQHCLW